MAHAYHLDCAVCNCHHHKPLVYKGVMHRWVRPSAAVVELRKKQKRSRRKSSF